MKFTDTFISIVKGSITGIISLIPGVSTGSSLVSLGVYDSFIASIANILKQRDKAFKLIFIPTIIGLLIGMVAGHNLITFLLNKYKMQTMFLIIGFTLSGLMLIVKKENVTLSKKTIWLFAFVSIISIILNIFVLKKISFNIPNTIIPIFSAIITSSAVIIPSLSIATFYITFDSYEKMIDLLLNLNSFQNIIWVIIFCVSFLICTFLFAKLANSFFKKYKDKFYIIICALLASSIIIIFLKIGKVEYNFTNIFTSLLAFLWGYLFVKNVEKE